MKKIKVAIVGVGNCATSLIQGVDYYTKHVIDNDGLMSKNIGGYSPTDIEFVAAFDVDARKIGKPLHEAIYELPNCTISIVQKGDMTPINTVVQRGELLDGVASHMITSDPTTDDKFYVDPTQVAVDVTQILKDRKVDILINYLPVGSQLATEFYMNCAIAANVAVVNCMPVFIASDPKWEQKFINAGLPIIGDDMKSQFGASILSQMFEELAFARGHKVKCHIQRNIGGNTDFHNMEDKSRLKSKKISKENVIRCQHDIHNIPMGDTFLHAGPSEYIKYYGDNKVANFRIELEGFGKSPVILDAQLSVFDSPNSAGVVIDAIRYLQVAREMGIVGALHGASAFTQKTPPYQMAFDKAQYECNALANRKFTAITEKQRK